MTIKYAGIALIAGAVLSYVSSLLFPGNALINPVDQTNFPEAVNAIANAPALAHLMIFLSILGMILMAFGFFAFLPLASRQGGLAGTLLKFGLFLSIIEWSIIIIAMGMKHFVTHLMQRAADAGTGSPDYAFFQESALVIHTDLTAVLLAAITIFPFASTLVGIGIANRVQSMNLSKIAAYLLIVSGVGGLITYLLAMLTASDPMFFLMVFNILILIGSIGLIGIGIGMSRGSEGFAEEQS